MIKTFEARIDENGRVLLAEPIHLSAPCRAIVMILDDSPSVDIGEITALSESALAKDWNRLEEDEAWSHLQPKKAEKNTSKSVISGPSIDPIGDFALIGCGQGG